MDLGLIREHLALAIRHVEKGEARVSRQRELAAELRRDGHDAHEAEQLLHQFEELQAMFMADRKRIEVELEECLTRKSP